MTSRADRLRAASHEFTNWVRDLEPGDVLPEPMREAAGRRKPSVHCRAGAREFVASLVVIELGPGMLAWQPRGEGCLVRTQHAEVIAVLEARLRPDLERRRSQSRACEGCTARFPTGSLVWDRAGVLFCERCHATGRATGGRPRAYCREEDWDERASASARRRLARAAALELEFAAQISASLPPA